MAVNMGEAVGYLDLDISKFKSSLEEAKSQANSATQSIAEKAGKSLQSAGKSMAAAGTALTKTVTVPIVAAGTAAVKTTADFDSAMSKVSAVSGATGDQLQALRDKAKEMGAQTKFSATESAQAFNYMAMAGWKTEEMLDGIDGIMALSAADGLDLATTSDIVTDALTAFGLSASDSAHFADVLAQASRNANTNVSMLGESFKYVAPVAGSLGYSVEDVSVALGLMANSGIKASQAGTSLRQALSQLISPTDKVEINMEKYGISLFDAEGQSKSLMEVMKDLRKSFGGITVDMEKVSAAVEQGDEAWAAYAESLPISDQEKMQALVDMFGTRAMPAMLSIINASESDFEKLSDAINDADGTAQEMADTMLDNLNGQLTLLKSALEGLAISLGELLMPLIRKVVSWVQQLVDKLNSLDESQKENIIRIGAAIAVIGPALLIVGKLVTAIGSIITAGSKVVGLVSKLGPGLKAVGTALGGISTTAAAVVAIVLALVAAFVTLWKNFEDFRNKIKAIVQDVVDKFKEAGQKITDALNALGFDFEDIVDAIKEIWEAFCWFIGPIFIGMIDSIGTALKGVIDVVVGIIQIITGIIKGFKDGDWSLFLDGITTLLEGCIQLLIAPFVWLFRTITEYLEMFGTSWEQIWQAISDFFVGIWNGIVQFFTDLWDGLCLIVTEAWNTIKNVVSVAVMAIGAVLDTAFQIITLPFRFIWENCKEYIIAAWEAITNTISTAINFIKDNIIVPVFEEISSIFTAVWNAITSFVSAVWNTISSIISGALNGIITFVTKAWEKITSVITSAMNAIKTTVSNIWNSIKSVVSNIIDGISGVITSKLEIIKSTATNILDGVKSVFTKVFDGIKSHVSGVVDWLKGIFNFKWELPHVKMPHFSIEGEFSLAPPSVPKLKVDWYKKAMDNGMILNSPAIFGYDPVSGHFMGGGDAGSEAVVGTNSLMNMISKTVTSAVENVANQMGMGGDIIIPVYVGGDMLDTYVVSATDRKNYRSGGR